MKKVLMGMMSFACCAVPALADLAFVQAPVQTSEYDFVIANGNLVVTVPAGLATGKTLAAGWGEYLTNTESSPVFLDANMVKSAIWTGAGDRTDLSDAANWTCTNFYGEGCRMRCPRTAFRP